MLTHWDGLTVLLTDPQVPLDNNAAERVLRGPGVGRKYFYGSRSRRGAKVATILYSLIETAKLQGRDPAPTSSRPPGRLSTPPAPSPCPAEVPPPQPASATAANGAGRGFTNQLREMQVALISRIVDQALELDEGLQQISQEHLSADAALEI